ncbi:hypothetical protein TI39_contig506g00001 [Zymoseptoria brevis]|uniref:Major facilitator superfamily (MFS) profile domain-containing protein n=1 Tax=Zymoseptoria brevis TaxID=1047168 RepID=A0A0F4GMA3_9PEZI|nr:hypothetical protein TI39_contig506g00001 [Zymoseptoria brevis]
MDPELSTTSTTKVDRRSSVMTVEDSLSKASRSSVMTVEDSLSKASTHSDALSIASARTHHSSHHSRYSRDYAGSANDLSRTHSNAIGGVVPTTTMMNRTQTNNTTNTTATMDLAYEVDFSDSDPQNAQAWPLWKKSVVVAIFSYATTCVVLYSTSYTAAIPGMLQEFHVSESSGILGVTTYLLGMACGSVVLAPLSEMYGRRPIYLIVMALFILFVIPCAVATNMATILVNRFIGAFCAAAMISNAPGTVNDIVDDQHRALAFSIWSIGPMNGPVIGPVVGGFVYQYMGWRWTNWVVVIVSAVAWCLVAAVPETYAPAILRGRAKRKRKEEDCEKWWSRYDDKEKFLPLLKVNLSRPFVLTVTEPIWRVLLRTSIDSKHLR